MKLVQKQSFRSKNKIAGNYMKIHDIKKKKKKDNIEVYWTCHKQVTNFLLPCSNVCAITRKVKSTCDPSCLRKLWNKSFHERSRKKLNLFTTSLVVPFFFLFF